MKETHTKEYPTYYPPGVKLVNAVQHSVPCDPNDMDCFGPTLLEYAIGDDGKIYQWYETELYDTEAIGGGSAHAKIIMVHRIKGWFEKGDYNYRKAIVNKGGDKND